MQTRRFTARIVLAPIALFIALLSTAALVVAGSTTEADTSAAQAAPIEVETPTEIGDDPFTPPADHTVRPSGPGDEDPDGWAEGYGPAALEPGTSLPGGPYGGTGSDLACDPELLIRELTARPDRLAAWARVLGLPNDADAVATFIRSLQPATLGRDTAVINHSFANGHATAFRAILQAGTAVLVDDRGVPVVRCRCGNPLLEPGDDGHVRRHPARIDGDTDTWKRRAAHDDRPPAKRVKDDDPPGDDDKPSDDPHDDACEPADADEHPDDDDADGAKEDEECDEPEPGSPPADASSADPADAAADEGDGGADPASDGDGKPDPPAEPAGDDDAPSGDDPPGGDDTRATGDEDTTPERAGQDEDEADGPRLVIRDRRIRGRPGASRR